MPDNEFKPPTKEEIDIAVQSHIHSMISKVDTSLNEFTKEFKVAVTIPKFINNFTWKINIPTHESHSELEEQGLSTLSCDTVIEPGSVVSSKKDVKAYGVVVGVTNETATVSWSVVPVVPLTFAARIP